MKRIFVLCPSLRSYSGDLSLLNFAEKRSWWWWEGEVEGALLADDITLLSRRRWKQYGWWWEGERALPAYWIPTPTDCLGKVAESGMGGGGRESLTLAAGVTTPPDCLGKEGGRDMDVGGRGELLPWLFQQLGYWHHLIAVYLSFLCLVILGILAWWCPG